MKQRFLKQNSFAGFEPHNILEYLLFYTIPIRDTNEIAHRLIDHFGSLSGVFDAPYSELIKVEGIGPHTASLIKTILPLSRAYAEDKESFGTVLISTGSIAKYIKGKYLGYGEEVLSIISMDNKCKVLSFDVVNTGSADLVIADIRRILETLMRTKASVAILAHNHPGGLAFPSQCDLNTTRKIIAACNSIGVKVIEHMIVVNDECISMKETYRNDQIFNELT